jgi:hypothetical protein
VTTGRPIATKCPKCRRGQYGKTSSILGCRVVPNAPQRESKRRVRRGYHVVTLTNMTCLDCGHAWWTTLEPKRRD